MTLVEFLSPLSKSTNANKVLAVLYYYARYEDTVGMTVEEVRAGLRRARVKKVASMNIADVLSKSGAFVDTVGSREGRKVWTLTTTGEKKVRSLLGLPEAEPEIEHDVSTLTKIVSKVKDPEAKGFIEEAITCLRIGALRAAAVFLWSGAIRTLQEAAWAKGATALNGTIKNHDPKARDLKKLDDFAHVKDSTTLLALQDLGLIDKGQKGTLEEALNLRNRCGHPTKYRAGEKKVSSFIEDVVGIVY